RCAGLETARSRAFSTSSGPCVSRIRVSLAVAAIVITSLSIDRLPRADGGVDLRRRRCDPQAHGGRRGQHRGPRIHHAPEAPTTVGALMVSVIEAPLGGASVPQMSGALSPSTRHLAALL